MLRSINILCKQCRTCYDSASERKLSQCAERKETHGSLLHTRRSRILIASNIDCAPSDTRSPRSYAAKGRGTWSSSCTGNGERSSLAHTDQQTAERTGGTNPDYARTD